MAATFGSRPASVPAYTRQFQTLGPTASLLKVDTGKLPEVEPAGAIVPKIFEALGRMAGAAATADREEPATWQEQLADMPTDAEAMAQADPANRDLALNTALETAYGAGKDVQFGEMAERIYAKNEADLEGFEADWRNLRSSALDNLAPSWKPIAEAEFDRKKALYVPRIAATIRAQAEDEANAGLREAADAYTARAATAAHDDDAAGLAETLRRFEAAISARTDLSPEQKAKAHSDFKAGVAAQAELGRLDGIIRDDGLEPAAQYAADFKAGRAGGGKLAEAEREPIARLLKARLDDVRAGQRQAEAEKAAKAKSESERRLAVAEEAIAKGGYGRHELERDLQTNRFADLPDAPARLSAAIDRQRQERAEKAEAAARGAEAVAAGRDLAAADAGQADVDALWEAEKGADPTLGAARAIEIARRTSVLPRPAREAIADGLIYGTPEKRAEQARALVDLIKAAPAAAEALPAQLRAEATRITKRLEQGHDPKSATEGTDKALKGVGDPGLDKSNRRSELERDKFDEAEATSKAMAEGRGRVVPTLDSENASGGADPRGDNGGAGGGGDSDAVLNLGAVKVRLSKSEERKLSDRMLRDIEDHPKDEPGWPAGLGKEHLRSNAEHNFAVLFDKALRETGDKEAAYKQALKDLKDTWTKGGDGLLVPAGTISGRIQDQDYQPLYAQTRLESVDPGADAFLRDYLHASDEEIFNEAHRYGLDPDLVLLCRAVVTGTIQTPAEVDELVGRFRPFVGRDQLENTLKTIAGRGTEAQRLKTLNGEETKYLRDAYRKRVGGSDFAANVVDAGVDAVGGIRAAGKIAKEIASPTLKNFKDALPSLQKIKEIMGW